MFYFIHEITIIATGTASVVVITPVYHVGDEFYFMHDC